MWAKKLWSDSRDLLGDRDFSGGLDFAVQFLRVVVHGDRKDFFLAGHFQVLWYSPRVPAGAVSSKGHFAFGYDFA